MYKTLLNPGTVFNLFLAFRSDKLKHLFASLSSFILICVTEYTQDLFRIYQSYPKLQELSYQ